MCGACSTYGKKQVHTRLWWGNLTEIDHLEDMIRWKYNVEIDPKELIWKGVDWINLGHDRYK
jgi:hypothetical protein